MGVFCWWRNIYSSLTKIAKMKMRSRLWRKTSQMCYDGGALTRKSAINNWHKQIIQQARNFIFKL